MKRFYFTTVAILTFFSSTLSAVSPDLTIMKRSLKENSEFLEFINIAVSNFGNEEERRQLKYANQHHFNARLWYLQGEFGKSYKEYRASQSLQKRIYQSYLENIYVKDARKLLQKIAPKVVTSRDIHAEHLFNQGFHHLANAKEFFDKGYSANRQLYKVKLNLYRQGIVEARLAKKYAVWTAIEVHTPYEEKKAYKKQRLDEYLLRAEHRNRSDYEKALFGLRLLLLRKMIEDDVDYFLHNDDNYRRLGEGKESVLMESFMELKSGAEDPGSEAEGPDAINENNDDNNENGEENNAGDN